MMDFLWKLFDTSDYPARWHCGNWTNFEGVLFIIASLAIWAAYFTIPVLLYSFITKFLRNPTSKAIVWCFALFILSCGGGHLIDTMMFYWPCYRFLAVVHVITAIASWGTIYAIYKTRDYWVAWKHPESFRNILSSAHNSILLLDNNGQVVEWNRQAEHVFGWSREEAIGKKLTELFLADKDLLTIDDLKRAGLVAKRDVEITAKTKAGKEINISVTFGYDYFGGTYLYALFIVDMTDRLKLLETLERSNKDLEKFAHVTSHDLRTPLRGISNLSQWIEEKVIHIEDEDLHKYLKLLKDKTAFMDTLVKGILEYSKIGKNTSELVPVDTNEIVDSIISVVGDDSFKITKVGKFPIVNANRSKIIQIFENLIGNAIKHHDRPTGNITVSAAQNNDFYTFAVKDDGPGIDPKYHVDIFNLFQSLHTSDSPGIGLSLVKKIVEYYSGTIRLESNGRGCKFVFTIKK